MSLNLHLSIPDSATFWQQSQTYVIERDRWNAYLNQLSLNAFCLYLGKIFRKPKQHRI